MRFDHRAARMIKNLAAMDRAAMGPGAVTTATAIGATTTTTTTETSTITGNETSAQAAANSESQEGAAPAGSPPPVSLGGLLLSLSSASLVMLTAGTAYLFSLYGPQLATALQLTQSQAAFVGSCGNSGVYISGPFFGSKVDQFRAHPSAFFLFGGISIFFGYGIVSSAYTGHIAPPHFMLLAFVFLCIGIGSSACYHCSLATNYRNWPVNYRGIAVGVPVGFFGLSAFLFTAIATMSFQRPAIGQNPQTRVLDVGNFLWFLGTICLLINCYAAVVLRDMTGHTLAHMREEEEVAVDENGPLDYHQQLHQQQSALQAAGSHSESLDANNRVSYNNNNNPRRVDETTPLLAGDAYRNRPMLTRAADVANDSDSDLAPSSLASSTTSSWFSADSESPRHARYATPILTVPIDDTRGFEAIGNDEPGAIIVHINQDRYFSGIASRQETPIQHTQQPQPRDDYIPVSIEIEDISCFLFLDAYILAYIMFTVVGIGLAYINNVGAILVAFSSEEGGGAADPAVQAAQKTHVGLLSIVGFASRIVVGIASDFLHRQYAMPRTAWSSVSTIFMTAAVGVMAIASTPNDVLIASTLVGIAYGAVWTITPVLIGEYFGYHRFGQNWGTMTIVPAFGGQAFSYLLGLVFDAAISHSHGVHHNTHLTVSNTSVNGNGRIAVCRGTLCFQPFFYYAFWACLSAIAATVFLFFRRRSV